MNRQGRSCSARATGWVQKYDGKNLIKGYAKWFGVDLVCAVAELRMLGVDISLKREKQLRASLASREPQKRRCKRSAPVAEESAEVIRPDCDENFAFIAGYTSGGFPFGITREHSDGFLPAQWWEHAGGEEKGTIVISRRGKGGTPAGTVRAHWRARG